VEALLDAVLKREPLAKQLVFPSSWWEQALPEARELIAEKLRPQYSYGLPSNDAVYFLSKTWARCASTDSDQEGCASLLSHVVTKELRKNPVAHIHDAPPIYLCLIFSFW
jgi:hypothetical protein